jgi:hypothetical protein
MKERSEFRPITDEHDETGHTCGFEQVWRGRKPVALYVVFDGRRIAHRGAPGSPYARTWVSMEAGYEVVDLNPNEIEVRFQGRVQ